MKKYLSYFWFIGGVKIFDTETGSVSATSKVNHDNTEFGSLWRQNCKWFAFHNDDESLILQQGKNIWRVTPNSTASLTGYYLLRNFRIYRDGHLEFSIWYKPRLLFQILALLDPTHDALDAESDDYFVYLKEMWESWSNKPFSEFKNGTIAENIRPGHSDAPEDGT